MLEWGFSKPIYVETTAVDERLLQGLTIDAIDQRFSDLSHPQILFMSRIERSKGIYELIDAFVTIKECIPEAFLTIAGAGNESAKIREYIESKGIMNICLLGFIQGSKKRRVLNQTHLFVLPSYSEGMSNAILEAMAFGIPVIATKVGGLLDFFEDSIHGYYIDLKSSSSIATKSIEMLSNPLVMREMAHSNFNLSRERFVASVVVKRLEKIYDTLL